MDETTRPSGLAIFFFLMLNLILAAFVVGGHVVAWFMEQMALASGSLSAVSGAGLTWFVIQALGVLLLAGLAFFFSHNRLRMVYRGWLLGAVITLPGFGLRFLGPNNDQAGFLLQAALGIAAGGGLLLWRRKLLQLNPQSMLKALALIPWVAWPFLLCGAAGSWQDTLLALLAGLAFGLLTAALLAPTDHFLLDGLGAGTLLLILSSSLGYDGGQLVWIFTLPACGFLLASLMPATPGVILAAGLLAAIPAILIDPTELAIVLGDFFPWAAGAVFSALGMALALSLPLWGLSLWGNRPRSPLIPAVFAFFGWGLALSLHFMLGQPGQYGDRLFVILKDQADVSDAFTHQDRDERLSYVYTTLVDHANTTQAGLRQTLDFLRVPYQPYYLVNALEVQGGPLVHLYLMTRPEVDRIIPSPRLRPLPEPSQVSTGPYVSVQENPGWNIKMIGADQVWKEFGVTGQGIIVGQSDSGVDVSHPALASSYLGAQGGDDYHWFDPWNGEPSPYDVGGHGTHTLGTILGQGGIGVAPGAGWIGCVNLNRNLANPALYLDCMQFMLAPFPQGGGPLQDGDPSRAAHVLNNSWGCPPIEGCDPNALKVGVENLRAAGIFVVVSAGNDGPNCETVTSPLALYDAVFSVGAVNQSGDLADFSSRGPVTVDGSGRIKPDIVAPGVNVFSAKPQGTYEELPGTSMAGPHVVGAVALLWSANPELIGDIDKTEQLLIQTARRYEGDTSLGCFSGETPSNAYGYGLLDAYAAVRAALER